MNKCTPKNLNVNFFLPAFPADGVDVEGKAAAAEVEGSPEKKVTQKNQISIQFMKDR